MKKVVAKGAGIVEDTLVRWQNVSSRRVPHPHLLGVCHRALFFGKEHSN
jgi:hypothetical protein